MVFTVVKVMEDTCT